MKLRRVLIVSLVASVAMTGTASAGSMASAAKKGAPLAYAHVLTDGTVTAFGGKGTTSVSASSCDGQDCYVTFNGKYPDDIDNGKIVILSASDSGLYGVTNHYLVSATATQITVIVATFKSNDTAPSGDGFNLSVLPGVAPAP